MKWSDGAPFTADDFVFWFEDLYSNKEIVPTPIADMQPQRQARQRRQDRRHHGQFQFDVPYFLFDGHAGRRHADRRRSVGAAVAEVHLRRLFAEALSQAVPAEILLGRRRSTRARQGGRLRELGAHLHFKKDWTLNPELPTLGPWKTVRPINTPTWVLERNPFYWAVDTEGNQLPYIDQIVS